MRINHLLFWRNASLTTYLLVLCIYRPDSLPAQTGLPLHQVDIFLDSTGKMEYDAVQTLDFEPFDSTKIPKAITLDNCKWNYWLRFKPDTAFWASHLSDNPLLYFGDHHFVTLFARYGHKLRVTQGGIAQRSSGVLTGQTCYFILPSDLTRDVVFYVKIWNRPIQHFAITPGTFTQNALRIHKVSQFYHHRTKTVLSLCCMAIWAFVLLFTLAQYWQHRDRMYKYYVIYLLCLIISLLKVQEKAWGIPVLFSHFPLWFVWSEGLFAVLVHVAYRLFVSDIVDLKKHLPSVYQLFHYTIVSLIGYAILDTFLEVFFFREAYSIAVFVWFRAIIALITVYCIIRLFAIRTRVGLLIAIGSSLLYMGALTNLFILLTMGFDFQGDKIYMIIISATVELLLFSTALGFKSWQAYQERTDMQKQLYETRNRLSRDLHDDLGSTLSSIALNSRIAGDLESPEKMRETLARISEEAREASANVKDLVWAMHPDADSMAEMLARMRQFAQNTLEPQGIEHQFEVGEGVEHLQLDMETRRHLYLLFKEAINNAAKYAEAAHVHICLEKGHKTLHLEIADNGKGFDPQTPRKGNGLANMEARAALLGGKLRVESGVGRGTRVSLEI